MRNPGRTLNDLSACSGGNGGAGGIDSLGTRGVWVSPPLSPCWAHKLSPSRVASKKNPDRISKEKTVLTRPAFTCQAVSLMRREGVRFDARNWICMRGWRGVSLAPRGTSGERTGERGVRDKAPPLPGPLLPRREEREVDRTL